MTTGTAEFQRRCREIGEEILERARAAQPHVWQSAWWHEQATRLAERNERLKVQLFRFIDVLPALRTDRDIVRHLREYLDPSRLDLPLPLQFALDFENGRTGRRLPLRAIAAARVARTAASNMARRFITGSNADEAIRTILQMRGRALAFTLDLLGEATTSDSEADRHGQDYLHLLEALCPAARTWPAVPQIDQTSAGPQPRVNVSVKLSALHAQLNGLEPLRFMSEVGTRLRPILRRARQLGAFINIDMESYRARDLTLQLFKQLLLESEFHDWPHVGIVVQAYLCDSESDLRGLLDWVRQRGTPIVIRLVKGAYWDYETTIALQKGNAPPVWTRKWESDANYEKLATLLLESHRLARPAFASHNVRSLAAAMATAEALGLTVGDYEIQMLYGMGDPLKTAVARMGRCVRVYAPYGDLLPGMAYLIRRLLENTSNDSFLRQSFSERASYDRLLADPAIAQPPSAPLPQRYYQDTDEEAPMINLVHATETDFSQPANRERMLGALKYVRGEFGREYAPLIDNQSVHPREHALARNPAAPDEIIGRVGVADRQQLDQAVEIARRTWGAWRRLSVGERCAPLRKAAQALAARRFEFTATLVLEAGRPWREADREVTQAIDLMQYSVGQMEALDRRPRRRDLPGETNRLTHDSLGVAVVEARAHSAFWEPAAYLTAALVAGNPVVFVPAAARGVTGGKLVTLLIEAGLPGGALACLPGALPDACEWYEDVALFESSEWEPGVNLNTIIVDDSADLDESVVGAIQSAFECAGQRCDSCRRLIVLEPVYTALCQRLATATRGLVIGPPEDPATTLIGPLVDEAARDRVRNILEPWRREARVLIEVAPRHLPQKGYFVGPTIFADVRPDSPLAQQPIFGPVLLVTAAPDFDTALQLASSGDGLTAGVYSRSPAHIDLARRELRAGSVFINRKITGSRVELQPLGPDRDGVGGPDFLFRFLRPRSVTENTLRHGLAAVDDVQMTTHAD